jgi:carbonic anhydrase
MFESCAIGKQQSPIDIRGAVASKLPALQPDYPALAPSWVNNGHTIQVNLPEGAALTVGDNRYKLLQFHFHTPSEEAINGKRFDLVAHFVHRDEQGRLGVIAVLFKRGKPNAAWGQVLAHLPREGETIGVQGLNLGLASLLPAKLGYYAFEGSLTTPPCSEGVSWMVLKTPVEISGAQLATFRKLYSANARPLQALNGRVVRSSAE